MPPRYKIVVADNFHYMDENEYTDGGVFDTYDDAVAACRELVDRSLAHEYKPGMTADELFKTYTLFGDDPFIVGLADAPMGERFSAWTYAKERCHVICG
jgi:hypothetical protein